ncbi:MAG: hypothetical protein EAX96_16635 [Candidatus Lokiarchaeota archaeon]|nr:hypothetical protein [Candidatus Lokiarchaeota archaeon]
MNISKKSKVFLIVFIIFFTVFLTFFIIRSSIIVINTSKVDHFTVNSMHDGTPIHADVYIPSNMEITAPLIIVNHGYTRSSLQNRLLCSFFNKLGYIACSIDTRGHGFSGGILSSNISEWTVLGRDIMSVLFHLVDNAAIYKVNTSLIGIIGGSMGGYSSTAAGILYPSVFNQTLLGNPFNISAVVNMAFSGYYLDEFGISNETSPPNYMMIMGGNDILFNLPETYVSFKKVANISDTNEEILRKNYYGNFANYDARKLIIVPNAGHEIIDNYAAAQLVYTKIYAWFSTSFQLNTTNFEDITLAPTYFDEFELSRNLGIIIDNVAIVVPFAALFIILPWVIKKFEKENHFPKQIDFLNQKNRTFLGLGVMGLLLLAIVLGSLLNPFFTFLNILGSNFLIPFFILSIIFLSLFLILLVRNVFPRYNEEFPSDFLGKSNLKVGIATGFIAVSVFWIVQFILNTIDGIIFIGSIIKVFIFIIYIALLIPFFFLFNIFIEELIQRQFLKREIGALASIGTGLIVIAPGFLIYTLFFYLNRIYIGTGVFAYGDSLLFIMYAVFFGPIIYYITRNSIASGIFSAIYLSLWLTSLPMNGILF